MGYIEASAIIHAPVEVVWATLNDIDHTPQWVTGLENAEITTTGAYGRGTMYNDYNRLGPALQVTPWHITVFEPMSRQVHESESSIIPTRMTLNLSPVTEGTHVQMIVEYQFLPRLGLIGRALQALVMNHLIRQVLRQNLAGLNAYLSSRAAHQ